MDFIEIDDLEREDDVLIKRRNYGLDEYDYYERLSIMSTSGEWYEKEDI